MVLDNYALIIWKDVMQHEIACQYDQIVHICK